VCLILAIDIEHMKRRCGDKAEQYSLLEAGHVAQNVLLQATALGLASVPVGGLDEKKVAAALKLPAGTRPVYLLPVGYPKAGP
jgi:nitroreductase